MWILAVALITMTSPISCSKKSIVQRRIEEIDIWRDKYQNDAYLENYLTENFEQNQLKKFVYTFMNIVELHLEDFFVFIYIN